MSTKSKSLNSKSSPLIRPAINDEDRENQLIALATDAVEERIRNGTASSQELCHFLKLGTQKAKLEREMMEEEKKLLIAKTEALEAQKRSDELYAEALAAFQRYSGNINENL